MAKYIYMSTWKNGVREIDKTLGISKDGTHILNVLTKEKLYPYVHENYNYITIVINSYKFSQIKMATLMQWAWNGNLPKGFLMHHKDEDTLSDELKNLVKMSFSEHNSHHHKGTQHWLGKKHTEKTKKRMSKSGKDRRHSKETLMSMKNSALKGQNNPASTSSDKTIDEIRFLLYILKYSRIKVAKKFGYSVQHVSRIYRGVTRNFGMTKDQLSL